jgi:predicted transcriptional regulator of viral defense system
MNIINSVYKYIESQPFCSAFVVSDFINFGNYETIKKSLARLENKGLIRRVLRGVYDKPHFSKIINEYSAPSPHKVALALARNLNWNIAPFREVALNLLGISTQVPEKFIYNSSGPYKNYQIRNITIEFKHSSMKLISGKSYM